MNLFAGGVHARFDIDLSKVAIRMTEGNLRLIQQKIIMVALGELVKRTPVDTGRARGSWQVTSGRIPDTNPARIRSPSTLLAEERAKIRNFPTFGISYITNSVRYIRELEYGKSKQAPQGMARLTFQFLATFYGGNINNIRL